MKALMSGKKILTFEETDEIREGIEQRIEILQRTQVDRCEGDSA